MEEKARALGCAEPVELYCRIVGRELAQRLVESAEPAQEDLLLAGAMLATALSLENQSGEGFTVGELTLRPAGEVSKRCEALRQAAEGLLVGQVCDGGFAFFGVRA
jgi:hypothetical protein